MTVKLKKHMLSRQISISKDLNREKVKSDTIIIRTWTLTDTATTAMEETPSKGEWTSRVIPPWCKTDGKIHHISQLRSKRVIGESSIHRSKCHSLNMLHPIREEVVAKEWVLPRISNRSLELNSIKHSNKIKDTWRNRIIIWRTTKHSIIQDKR